MMKKKLLVLLVYTCLETLPSVANLNVIEEIGKSISKEKIMEKWPSNSVYQSFEQTTRFADGAQTVYRRYLVDEAGLNPGHLRENTPPVTHIYPVVEYHIIKDPNTRLDVLEGIEVFRIHKNKALFESFCVDIGIIPLPFREVEVLYPEQIWDGAEYNIVNLSPSAKNKKGLFVYGVYINKELYSILATRVYLSREGSLQSRQVKIPPKGDSMQTDTFDLSYLAERAGRFQPLPSSDELDAAKSLYHPRVLEAMKKSAEKGTPVFERMEREGILFQKHIEDFRYILPSSSSYYTSGSITVRTLGRFEPAPLSFERIMDWFIDLRKISPEIKIIFPENKDFPRTLKECREHFQVLSERCRHDKMYTYVACENGLVFLFQKDTLIAVACITGGVALALDKGISYTENLWKMLDLSGMTLKNKNGFIFGTHADLPVHSFLVPTPNSLEKSIP